MFEPTSYNCNHFILIPGTILLEDGTIFSTTTADIAVWDCIYAGSTDSVSPVPASVYSVSGIQNLSNHTECPMWFNYSSATNDCQCFQLESLKCDNNYKHASVNPDLILTYNSNKGLISSIKIQHQYLGGYNLTETGCVLLPDEISELNSYMCGPLNRKGYLICGDCKSGYGPGPFIKSCTNVCHFCQDTCI